MFKINFNGMIKKNYLTLNELILDPWRYEACRDGEWGILIQVNILQFHRVVAGYPLLPHIGDKINIQ